jgi:hypothetical protein
MKVLLTGATGLVGLALIQSLADDGHTLVALSRRPEEARFHASVEMHPWEPEAGPPPAAALKGVDAVVHLAGEPVAARRWTAEQKKRIRDSRVVGTRNLVAALQAAAPRPSVLVSASAVGFYGDRGDELLDEHAAAGPGFLSEVCQEWERQSGRASEFGMRVAQIRVGVVLSAEGGALPRMLPAFKFGVAGRLGSGRQWFPWIHIADLVGIMRHTMQSPQVSGPLNAAAPGIVTNAEFTKVLAGVLHRPAFLPAPRLALNLALGEMGEMLLASLRVVPRVALETGYQFCYPRLQEALENLLSRPRATAA